MEKCLLIIEKNPTGTIGLKKAKQRGMKTIFLTSPKYFKLKPGDHELIDLLIETDTNNVEATVDTAVKLSKEHNIIGVITFFEYFVSIVAHVAAALNLPGIPIQTAYNARNKFLMREAFSAGHVPIPLYRPIYNLKDAKEFAEEIGFPNVLKPLNMAASRNVFKNNNMTDLEKNFETVFQAEPPFGTKKENFILMEEYMDGPEFSVETVSFHHETQIVNITKKLVQGENSFVEVGHIIPASLEKEVESAITKVAKMGIEALGINYGITHTEVKLTKQGPKIVEIAARPAGDRIPELIEFAFGIDFWNAAISLALGEKPDLTPRICQSAGIFFLTAPPGKIIEITGLEKARGMANVRELNVTAKIGDISRPLLCNLDRLGEIVVIHDNPFEVEKTGRSILNTIKIMTAS